MTGCTANSLMTVNLKDGMPTVPVALTRMHHALTLAKRTKAPTLKLIHGYGSTGTGGKIRGAVRRELRALEAQGNFRAVIFGEQFSPFEPAGLQGITLCFALTQDEDYQKYNPGITIVIF